MGTRTAEGRDMMLRPCLLAATVLAAACLASPARAESTAPSPVTSPRGDLFPDAGHATVAGATGLPFLGIAEVGIGVTNGFAIAAVAGITPSVVTAGVRPRFRIATSTRTALVLLSPVLYYPRASAPGPGNVGDSNWVLARPELFLDGAISDRVHLAGGMGVIAAASVEALGQLASGHELRMPPYGDGTPRKGFAGGIWNTLSARGSWAFAERSHVFAEAGLVLAGVVPAEGVGGPPVVVTIGAQHAF